jgi:hypothetical protein
VGILIHPGDALSFAADSNKRNDNRRCYVSRQRKANHVRPEGFFSLGNTRDIVIGSAGGASRSHDRRVYRSMVESAAAAQAKFSGPAGSEHRRDHVAAISTRPGSKYNDSVPQRARDAKIDYFKKAIKIANGQYFGKHAGD